MPSFGARLIVSAARGPQGPQRIDTFVALLVAGLVLGHAGVAAGDGTYVKEAGGTVVSQDSSDIRLVAETVDLQVARKHLMAPDNVVQVVVSYEFANLTERAQRVTMGFPVGWDYREQYMQGEGYLDRELVCPLSDFVAEVAGRRVPTRLRPRKIVPLVRLDDARRAALEEAEDDNEGGTGARAPGLRPPKPDKFGALQYHLWEVSFQPGRTVRVVNRFRYDTQAGVYWEENLLRYVLRSGAAWAGTIGRATIRLRLGDKGCVKPESGPESCWAGPAEDRDLLRADAFESATPNPQWASPPGGKLQMAPDGKVVVVWELSDFEPDEDVELGYETALAVRRQVRERLAALVESHSPASDPAQMRLGRDLLLGLYGLRLPDAARQKRLQEYGWYVADAGMSEARVRKLDDLLARFDAALTRPGGEAKGAAAPRAPTGAALDGSDAPPAP